MIEETEEDRRVRAISARAVRRSTEPPKKSESKHPEGVSFARLPCLFCQRTCKKEPQNTAETGASAGAESLEEESEKDLDGFGRRQMKRMLRDAKSTYRRSTALATTIPRFDKLSWANSAFLFGVVSVSLCWLFLLPVAASDSWHLCGIISHIDDKI